MLYSTIISLEGDAPGTTSSIHCSFDNSTLCTCSWSQSSDDHFEWSITNGTTSSSDTGPSNDHTGSKLNVKYIYHLSEHIYCEKMHIKWDCFK